MSLISRGLWVWILAIAAAAVLVLVLIYATGSIQRITASWRGETGVIERTEADADFRIGSYERFHALCASVQTKEDQIAALQQELRETDPPTQRATVINSSIAALRGSRADTIHQYNSEAAQEHRESFLDSDLPERLDPEQERTECTPSPTPSPEPTSG